jgi:hypothetical protein
MSSSSLDSFQILLAEDLLDVDLSLESNLLGDRGVAKLGSVLERLDKLVKLKLNLEKNSISEEGVNYDF